MTHVAHPYIQRIGINRDWKSRWFTTNPKQFREYLRVDAALRKFFKKRLKGMSVDAIEIERSDKEIRIIIKTAKPGIIIGRSGEGIANLRKEVDLFLRKQKTESKPELKIDVEEVRSPESSARIVGQMIAEGLERRLTFRRVMKQTVEKVMANRDVQGVRVILSGRLGGADMARKEELKKGAPVEEDIEWTEDAKERIQRVPFFVRNMAKKTVLSFAKERGITVIDGKLMDEVREKVGM